jgi:hypothetical protein
LTRLLSEVPYAAFLAYSPNGSTTDRLHRISQLFVRALKEDAYFDNEPAVELAVRRLVEVRPECLESWFGPDVILVPAPRSSPFPPSNLGVPLRGTERDFLWVPRRICELLTRMGLAPETLELLVRERRVTRAAAANAADRPRPREHLESLACRPQLLAKDRLLVVDDVVTRGSTLLACASLLAARFPETEVRTFALVRSISNPAEFAAMRAPVTGSIALRPRGDTLRRP